MRRSLVVLTLAALLLVRVPAQADGLVFSLFGDYLDSLRKQAGIPGLSAAIVGGNDILWERTYGQQDVERSIAAQSDTPFHVDGITEVFTATLLLRCVEDGRLSLDEGIGRYVPEAAVPAATVRQVLTHTSTGSFEYRPDRFAWLGPVVSACTAQSLRGNFVGGLVRVAMFDSVPGADVLRLSPPADGVPDRATLDRYAAVLNHLATPYVVDKKGRASPSQYSTAAMSAGAGLVSTTRDIARFDIALRNGILIRSETLAGAWKPQRDASGQPAPFGLGWFAQQYNGEPVVWQFGVQDNASSALLVTLPARGLTLVLLANSDGLVKPLDLAAGDLTVSPFGRLFLGVFVR